MFRVNVKKHLIIALILGIIGVVLLFLKIIKVLPDENLYTLVALVFLLFGFALYLRPKMKIMKNKSEYLLKYREGFYNELLKDIKNITDIKEIDFYEKDNKFYYKNYAFEGLTKEEFLILIKDMLKDFITICFGEGDSKSKKTKIDSLSCKLQLEDGKVLESKLIEDSLIKI